MLARNQTQANDAGLTNIRFVEADAVELLASLETSSVDGVVCGWGICYMNHARFRAEVERVVRPGGFMGLIENRASTLKAVSNVFERVLLRHSDALVKHMTVHLPKGRKHLQRVFCKDSLQPLHAWDGDVTVPCSNGQAIAEYMLRSGASAGFLDALDPAKMESVMAAFRHEADRRLQRGRLVPVVHEYCGLLAVRQ
jgi:SAM-dependent methyltransferase